MWRRQIGYIEILKTTLDDNTYEIHLVKENEILSKDSTSHQKLVHGLKVLLAKNFIDNLREETYKGRRKKAEGGYIVGNCPYGFKKTDKLTAVVVPEQGEFIKKAFNYYASGLSLQQTRDRLADEGVMYRENCPRISRGHLHRLLQNHYYTGRVPFEDQIYEGKFETIIPIELFNKVQVMLTREKSNLKDYLFTGLIRCTRCGCLVTAELRKGIYTYYHCGGGGSRKCKQRSIHLTEDYVDRAFQRALDRISVPEERFLYLSKMLKTEMKSVHVIDTKGKDFLDEELLRLNEFASKLYQDRIDGKINEEFWAFKNKEIMETCKGKLSKMSVTQIGTFDEAMTKVNNIALIPEMYRNGGWEIKKQLARLCFSKIFLKGSVDQSLPNVVGYWDSNNGAQGRLEIGDCSGAFLGYNNVAYSYPAPSSSTSNIHYRGVQMDLSTGNEVYSGENVIPASCSCIFYIKF